MSEKLYNDSWLDQYADNVRDPKSIVETAIGLANDIIDDLSDNPKVVELKKDIKFLRDTIKNHAVANLVNANSYVSKRNPEIYSVSNGELVPVTREHLESRSHIDQLHILVLIMKYVRLLLISEKAGIVIHNIGKASVSHLVEAAVTTSADRWKLSNVRF